jgi:LPXTG-motif cell wall-anchored protein
MCLAALFALITSWWPAAAGALGLSALAAAYRRRRRR